MNRSRETFLQGGGERVKPARWSERRQHRRTLKKIAAKAVVDASDLVTAANGLIALTGGVRRRSRKETVVTSDMKVSDAAGTGAHEVHVTSIDRGQTGPSLAAKEIRIFMISQSGESNYPIRFSNYEIMLEGGGEVTGARYKAHDRNFYVKPPSSKEHGWINLTPDLRPDSSQEGSQGIEQPRTATEDVEKIHELYYAAKHPLLNYLRRKYTSRAIL